MVGSLVLCAACDRSRDEPPPAAAAPIPAPTPPPAATTAEPAPVPTPSPVVAKPPRVGVAQGEPEGIVRDQWTADGQCNVEFIAQQPAGNRALPVQKGTHATITGWALGPKGTTVPDAVHVRLSSPNSGDFYGTATKRAVREDVNALYPAAPKTALSGFEVEFDADQLPPGTYSVTTVMKVGDKTYICDNGRILTRAP